MNLFMLRNIKNIVFAFVFGIAGGGFADQILWPYFIERPLFYKYRLEKPPAYIKGKNLTPAGFADFSSLRLGERVFLLGNLLEKDVFSKTASEGMVKSFNQEYIKTNISEDKNLTGSPLFNIKGELLGLNIVDSSGNVSAVPISKIKSFLGF